MGFTHTILVRKDMNDVELTDALHYAMGSVSDLGQIVGFRDSTGLIITPSQVCKFPEMLRSDEHEIMLMRKPSFLLNSARASTQDLAQTDRFHPGSQRSFRSLYGADMQIESPYEYHQRVQAAENQTRYNSPDLFSPQLSTTNMEQSATKPFFQFEDIYPPQKSRNRTQQYLQPYPTQQQTGRSFQNEQNFFQDLRFNERAVINLVMQMPQDDILTENMKKRIVNLIQMKDRGILGALMLYQDDCDFEGLKARIIHKLQTPSVSRGESFQVRQPRNQIPSSQGQGKRTLSQLNQDRYINCLVNLETKGYLDQTTAEIVKQLVYEKDLDAYNLINQNLGQIITAKELGYKLQKLVRDIQKQSNQNTKRSTEIINYVFQLAKYNFRDPSDLEILKQLIQEENEFLLSVFDVFEQDQDKENLLDSLARIIEKNQSQKPHQHFHMQRPTTGVNGRQYSRPNQQPTDLSPRQNRFLADENTRLEEQTESGEEQRGFIKGGGPTQKIYVTRESFVRSNDGQGYEFRPTTTVHDVALIPNYFSSGEEDLVEQFNQHTQRQRTRSQNYEVRNAQDLPTRTLNTNINANYFYDAEQDQNGSEEEDVLSNEPQQIYIRDQDYETRFQYPQQVQIQQEYFYNVQQQQNPINIRSLSTRSQNFNEPARASLINPQSLLVPSNEHQHKVTLQEQRPLTSGNQQRQPLTFQTHPQPFQEGAEFKPRTHEDPNKPRRKKKKQFTENSSQSSSQQRDPRSLSKQSRKSFKSRESEMKHMISRIWDIIDEEEIEKNLRQEQYLFLQHALKEEQLNKELIKIFKTFEQTNDSATLMMRLMSYCEDFVASFYEQNFTNQEVNYLMRLREKRDYQYIQSFVMFGKRGSIEHLVTSLKRVIAESKSSLTHESSHSILVQKKSSQLGEAIKKINSSSSVVKTSSHSVTQSSADKEQLRYTLNIALQFRIFTQQDVLFLERAFEKDDSPELQQALISFKIHNDYVKLTKEVKQICEKALFKEQSLQSDCQSLNEVIHLYLQKNYFTQNDVNVLENLISKKDINIGAIWEVYQIMRDEQDMLESLKVLTRTQQVMIQIKQPNTNREEQTNTSRKSITKRSSSQNLSRKVSASEKGKEVLNDQSQEKCLITLLPTEKASNSEQSFSKGQSELDEINISQSSQEQEIPADIGPCVDPAMQANQQLDQIDYDSPHGSDVNDFQQDLRLGEYSEMQLREIQDHQHTILRKYLMTGMISYADAPAFHSLVNNRDYRIVCIFEVFSQNRCEDDFLESLALISQIIKEQEQQSSPQQSENGFNEFDDFEEPVQEIEEVQPEDSFDLAMKTIVSSGMLDQETCDWACEKYREKDKHVNITYKTLKRTNDSDDFTNSIKQLYKRHQTQIQKKEAEKNVVQVPVKVQEDPLKAAFIMEVESLANYGKFCEQTVDWCKQSSEAREKKLLSVYQVYLKTMDRDDFIHTIQRFYKKEQSKN